MQPSNNYQPLSPHDFSFYGYDIYEPRLRKKVERLGIWSGEPAIEKYEDIIFIPSQGRNRTAPMYTGGFIASDGERLTWSGLRREGSLIIAALPEQVELDSWDDFDGEVLYLGWLFGHFGHMMVESLARVWALDAFPATTPVVFNAPGGKRPEGMLQHVLDWFGIPASRILIPDRPTRFRRVFVPEPLHELHASAHERYPDAYRDVALRLLAEGPAGTSDQPVYISRRQLQNDKRPLTGELELEDVLQENGFLIARPESMSFADQVRLFNRHKNIFAVEQTALNQILFAFERPHIHCISTWDIPLGDFFLLPKVSGSAATIVNGAPEESERHSTVRQGAQLLDLSRLFDYFEQEGFLKRRQRADLARHLGHLEQQFQDAVLYQQVTAAIRAGMQLPPAVIREAECRADSAWLISAVLAHYYHSRDAAECEKYALRFAELAASETDLDRLARYQENIGRMMSTVARRCSRTTEESIRNVVAATFSTETRPHANLEKI